jgi:hypothetical protein
MGGLARRYCNLTQIARMTDFFGAKNGSLISGLSPKIFIFLIDFLRSNEKHRASPIVNYQLSIVNYQNLCHQWNLCELLMFRRRQSSEIVKL